MAISQQWQKFKAFRPMANIAIYLADSKLRVRFPHLYWSDYTHGTSPAKYRFATLVVAGLQPSKRTDVNDTAQKQVSKV